MTSGLQQLELGYDQTQDRLLLSISTQDLTEFKFWITRRATIMLWGVLMQLLKTEQKDELSQMQVTSRIARQIQQEKAQRNPTANQLSNSATQKPLGEEPLLSFGVKARPATDESPAITLQLEDNQSHSLQIGGDSTIVLALCQLIRECEQLANWKIDLTIPKEEEKKEIEDKSSKRSEKERQRGEESEV